jgi:hypothetical protein
MKEDDEKVLKYKTVDVAVQCMWKTKPKVFAATLLQVEADKYNLRVLSRHPQTYRDWSA